MQLEAHRIVKEQGQVVNLFGRPRRIPDAKRIDKIYGVRPHEEHNYDVRNMLNLAVNHRIQSTGASIVNRAAIRFMNDCKNAGIEAKILCQIHDEIVVECKEEDSANIAILLENAMINTVELPGVPLEAKPWIAKSLAK